MVYVVAKHDALHCKSGVRGTAPKTPFSARRHASVH